MMLARRHVYEHDGGVATPRYVSESGDAAIVEGQLIRETQENAHRLAGHLNRALRSLDADFHEVIGFYDFWIKAEDDRRRRLSQQKS
jgi:hypothetical protein